MLDQNVLINLTTALNKIEEMEERQLEDRCDIKKLQDRLSAYDLLAAKWGGMCILAMGLGTFAINFSDKVKAWVVSK